MTLVLVMVALTRKVGHSNVVCFSDEVRLSVRSKLRRRGCRRVRRANDKMSISGEP